MDCYDKLNANADKVNIPISQILPIIQHRLSNISKEQAEFLTALLIKHDHHAKGHMEGFAPNLCNYRAKKDYLPYKIKVSKDNSGYVLDLINLPDQLIKIIYVMTAPA